MNSLFAIALRVTVASLVLTGLVYPLAVTGLSQLLFPSRANGSLTTDEKGQVVGSELIAQGFTRPGYFQPRGSAAGAAGYDATASSGTNLGPTSRKLKDSAAAAAVKARAENPEASADVPSELVTSSASGLDPHLSPEAALWQVARVAKSRQVNPERVRTVVEEAVEGRDLAILGEPRVNVLKLNLALDRQFGRESANVPAR
jgi:K+-transporting ATPase ATPase C chain